MRVIVVTGPPGAGKSTYVRENSKPGDVLIDYDVLAQAMGSPTPHEVPPAVRSVAWAARSAAIARSLDGLEGVQDDLGADVWLIQWDLAAELRQKWIEAGCEFVDLDPGEDVVMQRLQEEGRPQSSIDAARAWYERRKDKIVRFKSAPIDVTDLAEGQFTGYASVFGNVDAYGDVVVKGAFSETLTEYGPDGAGIPCYWGHRMDDPRMNLGQTLSAVEDERGLNVTVQLDLDSEMGAHVHRLIKQGRVRQMSFAYDVLDGAPAERDGLPVYELRRVKLHEVSVVPIGANPETELLAVKHSEQASSAEDAEEIEEPTEDPSRGKVEAKIARKRVAAEAALFISQERNMG